MTRRVFTSLIATALFLLTNITFAGDQLSPKKIACIGDSITFGYGIKDRNSNSYPAQLAVDLEKNYSVKNFGVCGATLLKRGDIPYWDQTAYKEALAFNPDIVIIILGTNDTKPKNWKYKSEYVSDYVKLIKSFQKLKSKPTVWICDPVPAYPGRWGISNKVIKEEILPLINEVARKTDVKIINLYAALSDKKDLFPDTVHPNAAGAKIMAATIARAVIPEQKNRSDKK